MSWDQYIDNLVEQSKDGSGTAHIDRAVIIGLDGGAPWTSAGHAKALKGSAAEYAAIAKALKSKDFSPFQAGGCHLEGLKYTFLREDGKAMYVKKKGDGSAVMQASNTAVVIAHCPEGYQQGNANKATGVIADYLESLKM